MTDLFCPKCLFNPDLFPGVTCSYRVNYIKKKYRQTDLQAKEGVMKLEPDNCKLKPSIRTIQDRMLLGIFTYDGPNERDIRQANRDTHLSYFQKHLQYSNDTSNRAMGFNSNTICTLQELMTNQSLASDLTSCRFVYTFVMGGGVGNLSMRKKVTLLENKQSTEFQEKTRCLWEDPECGGTDIQRWTLTTPKCNISDALANELQAYHDITFLSIPENHELGKTDTWFTYLAMLTQQNPSLRIGFVGKLDSDNYIHYPSLVQHMENNQQFLETKPHVYAGYAIRREECSKRKYGYVCAHPDFLAPQFVAGAMVYVTSQLAQHVFLNGTSLTRKRQVWYVGEDMQLGNMVFSDPNITVHTLDHRKTGGLRINKHCFNNATLYRKEYYQQYFNATEEEFKHKLQAFQ